MGLLDIFKRKQNIETTHIDNTRNDIIPDFKTASTEIDENNNECIVEYAKWEMDCCGVPFSVGSLIKWCVVATPETSLILKRDYCYSGHAGKNDIKDLFVLNGKVKYIKALYQNPSTYKDTQEDDLVLLDIERSDFDKIKNNIEDKRLDAYIVCIERYKIIPVDKSINAIKEKNLAKIYIQLSEEKGKYNLSEIDFPNFVCDNYLEFTHNSNNTLSYTVPKYNNEIKLYNIFEDTIKQMDIYYNEKKQLDKIEIINNEISQLIYINFSNYEIAKSKIKEFSIQEAENLIKKLKNYNDEILRVFIERFYDGETADISLVIETKSDAEKIIKKYNGDLSVIDNSGDYPTNNRISISNENLKVMLHCINENYSTELFNYSVEVISNYVKENLENNITKTDDFKFIIAEYD